MKRYWTTATLLFLTLTMLSFRGIDARSGHSLQNNPAEDLIEAVNALRAERDLPPFRSHPILMNIAQQQVDYIAGTGIMTHFDASGRRPYQRAVNAGYPLAGDLLQGGLFFENIHSGKSADPQEILQTWLEDPQDSKLLLAEELTDVGVGYAQKDNLHYFVLDASAPSTAGKTVTPTSSSLIYTPTSGTQVAVVITSTQAENGAVYHIVQPNEALWGIAQAYSVSVDELKLLNGLASDNIFIGQKLLIVKPVVITETPEATVTVTLGIPSSTPTVYMTPTITPTFTPLPTPPSTRETGGMIVGGIVLVALLAAGIGAFLGGRKKAEH